MTLRNPTVSVALHWRKRPAIGYGVCVPDDASPDSLDWSWTRNLEVIIFRRGDAQERVQQAVRAIEDCRPRRLLVIDVVEHDDCKIISIVAPTVAA
ncbi:MAG: hypothetical protein U1F15_08900 [Burkholderiales bacterium]